MDIAPNPDPSRYLPKGTDTQRLRGDLEKIGADMRPVMEGARIETGVRPLDTNLARSDGRQK